MNLPKIITSSLKNIKKLAYGGNWIKTEYRGKKIQFHNVAAAQRIMRDRNLSNDAKTKKLRKKGLLKQDKQFKKKSIGQASSTLKWNKNNEYNWSTYND